jgi:type I restriction enzyme S subunit
MRPTEDERQKLLLAAGDILFVRTNANREHTGRCAVFNHELQEALFASYLIRVRLEPGTLLPRFAQMYAGTSTGQSFLSGRASPAADGKFNINTQTIRRVRIPRPSTEEQREIVQTLEAAEAKILALEKEFSVLLELFRAMLEELMTGRLSAVPLISEEAVS